MKKRTTFKSVDDLVCKTTSKTFQQFWKEYRRHERVLQRLYAKDKKHVHVPEVVGTFSEATGRKRVILEFKRCAICMKDLP